SVHGPREVGAGEVQVGAYRRERDVDDRSIDHDHELRHRQEHQGEVLATLRAQVGCCPGRTRAHLRCTADLLDVGSHARPLGSRTPGNTEAEIRFPLLIAAYGANIPFVKAMST